MNNKDYATYIAPAPHYFQANDGARTLFFALTNSQLYFNPDFEGPPRKEDIIIPVCWEENGGEVKVDEMNREYLLSLDIEEESL